MADVDKADPDDGFGLEARLQTASVQTIHRLLMVTNTINACLLLLAAILALIQSSFSIILLMTAIYVGCFACCLLCFEFRLKRFERLIYTSFGFMFSFCGRVAFFFFIGTLSIGFNSPAGYVAVAYTGVNLIFNYYCMRVHPEYAAFLKKDNETRRYNAAKANERTIEKNATRLGIVPPKDPKKVPDPTPESAFEAGTQVQQPRGVAPTTGAKGDWEKLYDENTKLYYYHNHSTGETRWEEP